MLRNIAGWKTVLLLSVIIPMSLFATFRSTGILHEPLTVSETINVEIVSWNMTRPTGTINIDKVIENAYSDGKTSISSKMLVAGSRENLSVWPSDGDDDIVDVTVRVDANISLGQVYSVTLRFSEIDAYLLVYIDTTPSATFAANLKIERYSIGSPNHDALVVTSSIDRPQNTSLTVVAFLALRDNNKVNHNIQVTCEVIYFNETAYRQINIPIKLGVVIP